MGMTIKKAKAIVKGITDKIECNTADIDDWAEFWGFTREEYEEFLDMAIETMRKYQEIVNIVSLNDEEFKQCGLKELKEILEVIADGNAD